MKLSLLFLILSAIAFIGLASFSVSYKKSKPFWFLIATVFAGSCLTTSLMESIHDIDYSIFFLFCGPGLIFGFSIGITAEGGKIRQGIPYSLGSGLIYFCMVSIASFRAGYGGHRYSLILASTLGAILATLLFQLIYSRGHSKERLMLVFASAAIGFFAFIPRTEYLGFILWQTGVGLVIAWSNSKNKALS